MSTKQASDSEFASKPIILRNDEDLYKNLKSYKKIMIVGCTGAGKSILSRKLSENFNIPHYPLDQYFWGANWLPVDSQIFEEKVDEIVSQKEWIMDGNFGATFERRWPYADAVVYVEAPTWLCLLRQVLRSIKSRVSSVQDISRPEDCPERFNTQLFWFTVKFKKAHGRLIKDHMRERFPQVPFFIWQG